ncbi:glycosyltransferase family 4 protein [Microbacterium sp. LWH10-1.2]|uniref:glycosyltransferase family 4 protein n=1 Tax=Microbacterium sp. LWH10-1.2 TaxID=3135255 RepID=UPI0031393E3B
MRFAFVVNNYPPRVGGVELHVRNLARRLHEQGHDVLIVTLSESTGIADEDGIEVIRMAEHLRVGGILGFPSPGATRRIARLLRERHVDVVSIHTRFFPMSWVGLRAAKRAGAAVLHTEHGSDHVVSSSAVVTVASRLVDHTFGKAVLRAADEVLGVSENVVAFVERLSGRADAHVFYNAIDPASAEIERTQRSRVVFVGRLVPGKGAEVFVETVARLRGEGRDVTAEILGDGVSRPAVEEAVTRAGLGDRVVLRGRVDVDEVSSALAGSVLINPSILAEGFQITLLEALEVGGSVVSYDLPGVRTLREAGQPVRLVEQKTPEALAEAAGALLDQGWTALPMDDWHWSVRATQYADLAGRVLRDRSRNPR